MVGVGQAGRAGRLFSLILMTASFAACHRASIGESAAAAQPTTSVSALSARSSPQAVMPRQGAGRVAPCTGRQLRIRLGPFGLSLGTAYQQIDFRNQSDTACTLGGYPLISYTDAQGRRIGLPVTALPGEARPRRIVVTPKHSVHATLAVGDPGNYRASAACRPAKVEGLLVGYGTPRQWAMLRSRWQACTALAHASFVMSYRLGTPITAVG